MIFLRFYLFFLIFFITGEVHAETTPYMFSHQYCAQGIHKLSPDGKLIARQHLLPQDKASLGIQARQYGLEILDARTLDSMFFYTEQLMIFPGHSTASLSMSLIPAVSVSMK